MPELFIDPAKTMSESYSATTGMLEDMQSKSAMKEAYAKTEADPSGSKDMFKVNSLASQMAAASGNTRAAEKFEKQAQASKASNLENSLNTIKQKQAQFGEFERHLQLVNDPDTAIKYALASDLSDQEKMQVVGMIRQAGNDPQKFAALKDKFQQSAMDAKDRLSAQQKVLQMQLNHEDKLAALELRREGLGIQAGIAAGNQELRKDWNEFKKGQEKAELELKQEKADNDIIMNYDKLITQAEKIKDPEARKKRVKALERRRQEAEDRQYNRGIEEGKPDSLGRHKAKTGQPPTITSKEEYDKLQSGDVYIEDGKKYRKP